MSWYHATRDIPYLKDYAAAATYEANVKPIRGKSPELKPLGSRRKQYLSIRRVDHGEGRVDIQILSSSCHLIIFQPDGYIKVSGIGYSSTQGVQGKILGANLCQHDSHPWISRVLAPCDPDGDKLGAFPLREGPHNLFRREADGRLRYVNPLYPMQHVVRRKEMNALLKKYPEFRKFGHAMIKLQGEGTPITTEFMIEMWGKLVGAKTAWMKGTVPAYPHNRTLWETLSLIDSGDSANWADAVTYLCWAYSRWRAAWDLEVFNAQLKRVLVSSNVDKVFEKKTITTGKWVKDPNRRFVAG